MSIEIRIEDPAQPEVCALLAEAEADAYYATLYPAKSNHLLGVAALRRPEVVFFVARLDGAIVGCGSVLREDTERGEIKRMYVIDAARGRGVGRTILTAIEQHARALGIRVLCLETGVKQAEAHALYRTAGFRATRPFGVYRDDPLSLFMEKRLTQ